ncbi:hypothetical protein HDV57DRAFT_500438 [Trichoderma longibrachiatum]
MVKAGFFFPFFFSPLFRTRLWWMALEIRQVRVVGAVDDENHRQSKQSPDDASSSIKCNPRDNSRHVKAKEFYSLCSS